MEPWRSVDLHLHVIAGGDGGVDHVHIVVFVDTQLRVPACTTVGAAAHDLTLAVPPIIAGNTDVIDQRITLWPVIDTSTAELRIIGYAVDDTTAVTNVGI